MRPPCKAGFEPARIEGAVDEGVHVAAQRFEAPMLEAIEFVAREDDDSETARLRALGEGEHALDLLEGFTAEHAHTLDLGSGVELSQKIGDEATLAPSLEEFRIAAAWAADRAPAHPKSAAQTRTLATGRRHTVSEVEAGAHLETIAELGRPTAVRWEADVEFEPGIRRIVFHRVEEEIEGLDV